MRTANAIKESFRAPPRQIEHRADIPREDRKVTPILDVALHACTPHNRMQVHPYPAPPLHALFAWMYVQLLTPRRLVRLLLWLVSLYPRSANFLRVQFGGSAETWRERDRNAICVKCPQRIVEVRLRHANIRERWFCNACGCPQWWAAELHRKNRKAAWLCPMRRHAGPYPDDAMRTYLTEKDYATTEVLAAVPADRSHDGGCGGPSSNCWGRPGGNGQGRSV